TEGVVNIRLKAPRKVKVLIDVECSQLWVSVDDSERFLQALAEACLLGDVGFKGDCEVRGRLDAALFGEAQGRIVVSVRPGAASRLVAMARELSVPVSKLGTTTEERRMRLGPIDVAIGELRAAYEVLL
ncbi:hypothetical protein EDM76_08900, partial [bacterium]